MSHLNFDIALYSSPFFENLVSEFYRISRYKRNIYKKIRNEEEYKKKLSPEERAILHDLSVKENKVLLEILTHKNWVKENGEIKSTIAEIISEKYEFVSYPEKEDYSSDLL